MLRPLDQLTDSVEELARTTDVSQRLDPGGPDELGRLRRAFNRLLAALDSSRESQRQLVLDASHELRTPLTSLRTNMEVARQMEKLAPEDRDVLIGDVLTQLDELTSLVADMAELARGDLPQVTKGPLRFDELVLGAVEAATTHGRSRGVTLRHLDVPELDLRLDAARSSGRSTTCSTTPSSTAPTGAWSRWRAATASWSSATTAPGWPTPTSTTSSTASTGPPRPAADPGPAWDWPSWPRWRSTRAGRSACTTPPAAVPCSAWPSPRSPHPTPRARGPA